MPFCKLVIHGLSLVQPFAMMAEFLQVSDVGAGITKASIIHESGIDNQKLHVASLPRDDALEALVGVAHSYQKIAGKGQNSSAVGLSICAMSYHFFDEMFERGRLLCQQVGMFSSPIWRIVVAGLIRFGAAGVVLLRVELVPFGLAN